MVSVVRGQIADPHCQQGAGGRAPSDIRRCISCNQMCWGRRSSRLLDLLPGQSLGGPRIRMGRRPLRAGREGQACAGGGRRARPGSRRRGLPPSAAISVTLAEASDKLGGQFRLAGMQPRRAQILDLLDGMKASSRSSRSRVHAEHADGCRRDPGASAPMRWCIATGSQPGGHRLPARHGRSREPARPRRAAMSVRSRRSCGARPSPASACSCWTMAAIGAARHRLAARRQGP